MPNSLHHINQRKRLHQKSEQFPNPHPGIRFLDRFLIVIAVLGPIISIPQIIALYNAQSADGFAFITWFMYLLLNVPWIVYGFVHREKPIIAAYLLWFISNLLMVIGIILYS